MATIQFGGGISNAVGSAGGSTFSKNKGGPYIKKRGGTINPRSAEQTRVRSYLASTAKEYSWLLTDSDRAGWRALAATTPTVNRLGNTTFLSGQQLYSKFSANIRRMGLTPVVTAPVTTAVTTPLSLSITATSGGGGSLLATLGTTGSPGGEFGWFYVSPPLNPGRNFVSSQLRLVVVFGALDAPVNLTSAYTLIFGALPTGPGQRVFVRGCVVDGTTGVKSVMVQDSTLWT